MAVVVLVSAIVMVVAIAYSAYMMATMKTPSMGGNASSLRDRTQVVRSSVEPRQFIYGQVMVSGPLVYILSTGAAHEYLYMLIALAGHQVEEIGDVYLGDKLSTDPVFSVSVAEVGHWVDQYSEPDEYGNVNYLGQIWVVDSPASTRSLVEITKHLGSPDQAADAGLMAASGGQWTANHRLRGVAYVVVRLEYNSKAFPNGITNIKCVVKGNNQIYDPRTGTTGYTNNWALCIRDYLTKAYGILATPDEINNNQAVIAANICDEDIALASGGTEKRYTMNGTFGAAEKPIDIVKKLLTGAVGNVVWSQGQYYIQPAAYTAPVDYIITESDLSGALGVQPTKSSRDKFNTVRGTFCDPTEYWQPVDFPYVTNSLSKTLDGRELAQDIELSFTTSSATAQRLAKIHLERELQGIVVSLPGKLSLFGLKPGDVVPLSIASMGWVEKEFRVIKWEMSENGGVNLSLIEESAASYDWNSGMETVVDPAPNTMLPDPFNVPAPQGLTATESLKTLSNGTGFFTQVQLDWQATSATVNYYIVQMDGISQGQTIDDAFVINDVTDGNHTFAVMAVSMLGVTSAPSSLTVKVLGKTAPPANVLNLRASATSYGGLILSWDAVADVDLLNYSVRFSNNPASAWENALDMGTAFSTTLTIPAALDGIYLVKAIDTGLRESLVAASVITTIPSLANYNAIAVADDGATWPGSKTGCYELAGKLYLDMAGLVDDLTDWDAWANIDTYGGARPEGYYAMAEQVDLGTVQTSRCAVQVDYAAVDTSSLFDSVQDFDAVANFDGSVVPGVNVQPQIRTSMDGSNWGDWMPFVAGDYTAMSLQFRLKLATTIPTNVPQVSSFAVDVDMPDRAERGQGVDIASGGTSINFSTPYMVPPIVRTTIIGATSGDTEKITNITTSGFTMQVLNAGSGVARTIDWQSVGY
jgi:hypothetical protein